MSNLFDNAKFGDKFRTRDGRCATYCKCIQTSNNSIRHFLFVQNIVVAEAFHEDGRWSSCNSSSIDIVSRLE